MAEIVGQDIKQWMDLKQLCEFGTNSNSDTFVLITFKKHVYFREDNTIL